MSVDTDILKYENCMLVLSAMAGHSYEKHYKM